MKACISTDLEGVGGIVSSELQCYSTGKYNDQAKKLLSAEVNAAVDGVLEAGVNEVLVIDGHGSGGICYEDLHPAAKLMHGRPFPPMRERGEIIGQYDFALMVGRHAMAGTEKAILDHTVRGKTVDYYQLNGKEIGENAIDALIFGRFGVPVIFLSGDDAACREAELLIPEITTVSTKQGLTRTCAISLSAQECRKRIREGVKSAVDAHQKSPVKPLIWDAPFTLRKRFFHTSYADAAGGKKIDPKTVEFYSEDIIDVL
ncbi:MAG: M55 family metallopeptidase [Desulfobacteraceae bacterium]|nr:M55 family metallopeptidase [Desulfobacteraceae bacterium]